MPVLLNFGVTSRAVGRCGVEAGVVLREADVGSVHGLV